MKNYRRKIPQKIQDKLLYDCRHVCCICQEKGGNVQIHHIDENKNNNNVDNLIVLCLNCHSRVSGNEGLGKKFSSGEIKKYRDNWIRTCKDIYGYVGLKKAKREIIYNLKKEKSELNTTEEDILQNISKHVNFIKNWSTQVGSWDTDKPYFLQDIYIELDIQLNPRKLKYSNLKEKYTRLEQIAENKENLVILGDPGSGKTTSIKKVSQLLTVNELNEINYNETRIPILIELRNLKKQDSIINKIQDILGLSIIMKNRSIRYLPMRNYFGKDKNFQFNANNLIANTITNFLDSLKFVVLIDGIDELNIESRYEVLDEIRKLILSTQNTKFIITCRSGAYNYYLENTVVYEICPLNKLQIKYFVNRYLGDEEMANKFLMTLSKNPYRDTANRPLILMHLCSLFLKYKFIPVKPKGIYNRLILLFIDEWDMQRGIARESEYAKFDRDKKKEFLARFAFELRVKYEYIVYTVKEMKAVYLEIYKNFQLPLKDVTKVIDELETHTGIIIKSSLDEYEFVHKSIQEYLAAFYICGLPNIPGEIIRENNLMNEAAIAVCLSSDPSDYLASLLFVEKLFPFIDSIPDIEDLNSLNNDLTIFLKRLYLEKPDFLISPILGVTFLYLIDLQLKISLLEKEIFLNTKTYEMDNLDFKDYYGAVNTISSNNSYAILVKFLKDKMVKTSLGKVKNYYKVISIGKERVLLTTKELKIFQKFVHYPKELSIPIKYLKEWNLT